LACLLQRLILLAALRIAAPLLEPVAAAESRFSHKAHLQMDVTCFTCHARAGTSAAASDDLMPSRDVCARCHAEDYEIREPRKLFLDHFHHQRHVDMAGIAKILLAGLQQGRYLSPPGPQLKQQLESAQNTCMACHRGMQEAVETGKQHFPQMADCLVCHNQINVPSSCLKCHLDSPKLRPATHSADWIDRHSRVLTEESKQSCVICHGKGFTCGGCH
jgi:hypothetical protein